MKRASNLRMIALTSAAAFAAVLPLAGAIAGPVAPRDARRGQEAPPSAEPGRNASPSPVRVKHAGPEGQEGEGSGLLSGINRPTVVDGDAARTAADCGPELASPEGVEAQTCVMAEDGDAWARTYYRNTTGGPLHAVLTLMRPDGRTVQVNCALSAGDEPGACESPRAPSAGKRQDYAAVAEIASAGSERLLLRSGSNSPASRAD